MPEKQADKCKIKERQLFIEKVTLSSSKLMGASFSFVSPTPPFRLAGAYYLNPSDASAIFLDNDLLCHDTCSVTGGA